MLLALSVLPPGPGELACAWNTLFLCCLIEVRSRQVAPELQVLVSQLSSSLELQLHRLELEVLCRLGLELRKLGMELRKLVLGLSLEILGPRLELRRYGLERSRLAKECLNPEMEPFRLGKEPWRLGKEPLEVGPDEWRLGKEHLCLLPDEVRLELETNLWRLESEIDEYRLELEPWRLGNERLEGQCEGGSSSRSLCLPEKTGQEAVEEQELRSCRCRAPVVLFNIVPRPVFDDPFADPFADPFVHPFCI